MVHSQEIFPSTVFTESADGNKLFISTSGRGAEEHVEADVIKADVIKNDFSMYTMGWSNGITGHPEHVFYPFDVYASWDAEQPPLFRAKCVLHRRDANYGVQCTFPMLAISYNGGRAHIVAVKLHSGTWLWNLLASEAPEWMRSLEEVHPTE